MSAQKDLANLLLSLFSADELRRWLRYLPGGDSLTGRLPGANASPASLASEAVMQLEKEGMIDADFWARMVEERPRRKGDIDKVKGQFAAVSAVNAPPVAAAVTAGQCTVLLVSASPDGEVRLRVDKEFRELITRMRGSKYRDRFKFEQVPAARFEDLRTALQLHEPQVLHISAHAEEDGSLLLEGKNDSAKQVTKGQLMALLGALGGLRLVVLNGCYSDVLAKELPAVSELAIGMSDAIADKAAIDFSEAFYESLGFGKSIETAFKVAVAGLEVVDANMPRLYPATEDDAGNRRKARLIAT